MIAYDLYSYEYLWEEQWVSHFFLTGESILKYEDVWYPCLLFSCVQNIWTSWPRRPPSRWKKKSVHLVDLINSYTTNILGQLQNHFPTSKKKSVLTLNHHCRSSFLFWIACFPDPVFAVQILVPSSVNSSRWSAPTWLYPWGSGSLKKSVEEIPWQMSWHFVTVMWCVKSH